MIAAFVAALSRLDLNQIASSTWLVLIFATLTLTWSLYMLLPPTPWSALIGHRRSASGARPIDLADGLADPETAADGPTADSVIAAFKTDSKPARSLDEAVVEHLWPDEPTDAEAPFDASPLVSADPADAADQRHDVDLTTTPQGLELMVDLPGLDEGDIQIEVTAELLTISAERRRPLQDEDKTYCLAERAYGVFTRTLTLPDGLRAEGAQAQLSRGVLTVTIPSAPAPAPYRIAVSNAAARLRQTSEGLELIVDMPGLDRGEVEIAVAGGVLNICGERKAAGAPGEAIRHAIALPAGSDADRARAELNNGVLTVWIPGAGLAEPKRIEVLGAG